MATQQTDLAALSGGRTLFVNRCARCHELPGLAQHSAQEWPGLVQKMAKRSGLNASQREAVLAYVLAARSP